MHEDVRLKLVKAWAVMFHVWIVSLQKTIAFKKKEELVDWVVRNCRKV